MDIKKGRIFSINTLIVIHCDCPYCKAENSFEYDTNIFAYDSHACENCNKEFTIEVGYYREGKL